MTMTPTNAAAFLERLAIGESGIWRDKTVQALVDGTCADADMILAHARHYGPADRNGTGRDLTGQVEQAAAVLGLT